MLAIIEPTDEIGGDSSGVSISSGLGVVGAVNGSAAEVESFWESWMTKDSSGMRRTGEEAVPRISPGLSSRRGPSPWRPAQSLCVGCLEGQYPTSEGMMGVGDHRANR